MGQDCHTWYTSQAILQLKGWCIVTQVCSGDITCRRIVLRGVDFGGPCAPAPLQLDGSYRAAWPCGHASMVVSVIVVCKPAVLKVAVDML